MNNWNVFSVVMKPRVENISYLTPYKIIIYLILLSHEECFSGQLFAVDSAFIQTSTLKGRHIGQMSAHFTLLTVTRLQHRQAIHRSPGLRGLVVAPSHSAVMFADRPLLASVSSSAEPQGIRWVPMNARQPAKHIAKPVPESGGQVILTNTLIIVKYYNNNYNRNIIITIL